MKEGAPGRWVDTWQQVGGREEEAPVPGKKRGLSQVAIRSVNGRWGGIWAISSL